VAESVSDRLAGRGVPPTVARALAFAWWVVRIAAALFFFVGALQLLKTAAQGLDVLNENGILVRNAGSTLGLGWLGALFVLSGSPVAATALALVAGNAISETQGFTMLTGSRLGAAFVVLVVATVYALRGGSGERLKPVSTAVMALSTTAVVYIPAAAIGLALLRWEPYSRVSIQFPHQFGDLIDLVYGGIIGRVDELHALIVFVLGVGILLLSFKLIDAVMPELNEETLGARRVEWLKRKWPMFALGSLVALITMSVSVALTVLVPLVAKRYVKREDIIPYIMGANITTLGDTMLASLALNSDSAVRIVLAGIVGATIVSVILLAFFYPQLRTGIWTFQRQVVKSKVRLGAFVGSLFLMPLALVGLSNPFG
jgi:solute carrier family 34 (sodium-dependent phosphate cotransporter)